MKKMFFLLLFYCLSNAIHGQNALNLEILDSMTTHYYDQGHYPQALVYAKAKTDNSLKEFGQKDSIYMDALTILGLVYNKLEENEKAEAALLEAKEICEQVLSEDHSYYPDILSHLSVVYYDMGRFDEAEPYYIKCKDLYAIHFGKDHLYYAISLNNLGYFYMGMGNYSLAKPLYQEMLRVTEASQGKKNRIYAIGLTNLARIYTSLQEYTKAEELFLEATPIFEEVFGIDHPSYGILCGNFATANQQLEKYEAAEKLFLKSGKIIRQTQGEMSYAYAINRNNLGFLYETIKDYNKAIPLYKAAIDIYAQTVGDKHPDYARSITNLADLYVIMEEYDDAWAYTQKAAESSLGLPIHKNIGKNWADSLRTMEFLSYPHFSQYILSMGIAFDLFGKEDSLNNKNKRLLLADLATQCIKNNTKNFSDEEEKLRMLSMSSDWMLKTLAIVNPKKDMDKAFELVERNKAGLLFESVKTTQAYAFGSIPISFVKKEKQFYKEQSAIRASLLEKLDEQQIDSLQTQINVVNQEIETLKKQIEEEYPKYAKLKYEQESVDIQAIQKALPNQAAIISYEIGINELYLFYIDQNQKKLQKVAVSAEKLKKKIDSYHSLLSAYNFSGESTDHTYKTFCHDAHWFFQHLIAPVLNDNSDISQLIIIPGGELGHLPFETFLTSKAKAKVNYKDLAYLIKDYKISYNYSASLWKENLKKKSSRKNNGQLLAMAASYRGTVDSLRSAMRLPTFIRMRRVLQQLPEARKEVEALSKSFKGFFGFDSLATEAVFKEKASDYAIIHLAMHGLLDEKRPILSSLAFTEDGDRSENNFLQAYEISKMELNAELVVLSACQTGYGRFEKGNGIASLARSFMYAGVPSLVVSLWQVNDQSTSIIMQNFYANLAKGLDKAAALQQAKIRYIEQIEDPLAAHPAFWAPFIQMGDASALSIAQKSKGSYWGWIFAGGLLFLSGLGFTLIRRKRSLAKK